MISKLPALLSLAVALVGAPLALAETTVKLSDVHLCCASCVKGVDKAVASSGATAACDRDAQTIMLTAADQATAQKAVNALVAAGYYGKSSDSGIKVNAKTGASDAKVSAMTVSGVHLCCNKCVTTVKKSLEKVPGVEGNTASKDAKTFEVTGNFKPADVFNALHDAGLTGKTKAE